MVLHTKCDEGGKCGSYVTLPDICTAEAIAHRMQCHRSLFPAVEPFLATCCITFCLGFATVIDPARTLMPASMGEFYWGGAYSTAFFVDPVEAITMVFMTQLYPSNIYPLRRQLKTLIYAALNESRA